MVCVTHEISFAEMITGYPLFRGRDNPDQLVQIMKIVGTPSEATITQIKLNSVSSEWRLAVGSLRNGQLMTSRRSRSKRLSASIRNNHSRPSFPGLLEMVSFCHP